MPARTLTTSRTTPYPSFRRPIPPRPVEAFDLPHPSLPPHLDGLTILHLSDLHARHAPHSRIPGPFARLLDALSIVRADLIVLTGDLMHEPGHEAGGLRTLELLAQRWHPPRIGVFGIFGNHDTFTFARAAAAVPSIRWLDHPEPGGAPAIAPLLDGSLRLLGLSWPEDTLAASLALGAAGPGGGGVRPASAGVRSPFTIALAHLPNALIPCASLDVPIVLCGHTHGGQVRINPQLAPYTASDAPTDRASGMLRLNNTLCCISRGLGDGVWPGLRWRCPYQAPLYTLRRAELPPMPAGRDARSVRQVRAW